MTPIVFLPGAAGSASFWRPVAEGLADLGPTHLFDYLGFGELPSDPFLRSPDDLCDWICERLPARSSHVIAQSMGGVLAVRLAVERPELVARLVLVATSGGVDLARLGGAEWRERSRALRPGAPSWFSDDRTDLTGRLASIRARTLLLWSDSDPISPPAAAEFLADRIPGARIVLVARGTHAFANERPEEVASVIRSHLVEGESSVPAVRD